MIPLNTTTIRVERAANLSSTTPSTSIVEEDPYGEGYDTDSNPATPDVQTSTSYRTVVSGIRAHISSPGGLENTVGGSESTVTWRLICDPCDIKHTDRVVDEPTGEVYEVEYAAPRRGLGVDHVQAGITQVRGAA